MRALKLTIIGALLLGAATPAAAQLAPPLSPELTALRDKELVAAGVQPAQLTAAMNYFVQFASEKDANNERVQSCKDLAKLLHNPQGYRLLKIGLPIQNKYAPLSIGKQDMSSSIEKNRANGNADWACMYSYIQVYIDLIHNDAAAAQKAMGKGDTLYMVVNGTVTTK